MQTATQETLTTQVTAEETAQTQAETVAPELKSAAVEFENFLIETVKNSNTFRQKRELTFANIQTSLISYLNKQVEDGKLADYSLQVSQSGVKKMGIYIVGTATLMNDDSEYTVTIKNKMNTWNHSGEVFRTEEVTEAPATETAEVAEA